MGAGGKNSADRSLLLDLMYWVSQNPPPAHLFLISGDRDFASILHRLRMNNYNILLASPENAPGVLCSAASIMWHWHDLLRGQNLNGKHFNQPPDGPYGSWYGHYKVPLLDPFADIEQAACPPSEESAELGSESTLRPIPKPVLKQIRSILNSNPKGLPITDLRMELQKSNLSIDRDLYGYKKFSRFLLSMPHILQLKSEGDGYFIVHGVTSKSPESFECNPGILLGPVSKKEDTDLNLSSKINANGNSIDGGAHKNKSPKKLSINTSTDLSVKDTIEVHHPSSRGEKFVEMVDNTEESNCHLPPVVEQNSAADIGCFKRIWRNWFGSNGGDGSKQKCDKDQEKYFASDNDFDKRNHTTAEKHCVSDNGCRKEKDEENNLKSSSRVIDQACPPSSPSSHNKSSLDNRCMSNTSSGIFNQLISWYKYWRGTTGSDKMSDHSCDKLSSSIGHCGEHELFSKDSFWSDMESFICTPKGSLLFTESRTRFVILVLCFESLTSVLFLMHLILCLIFL